MRGDRVRINVRRDVAPQRSGRGVRDGGEGGREGGRGGADEHPVGTMFGRTGVTARAAASNIVDCVASFVMMNRSTVSKLLVC